MRNEKTYQSISASTDEPLHTDTLGIETSEGTASTTLTPSRVKALLLTGLLDTPAEQVFDRFTILASQILGVPVALISLLDQNRQFFKSQVGLREPWATGRETPLSYSFCQYVVGSQQPLLITDARQHALVTDNPAIEELGVIAYAGIPLLTPRGEALGAFCAIDHQPHAWSEREVEVLKGLAEAVMTEIALRLKNIELQESTRQTMAILESITDAFFHLDQEWRFTYVNEQATRLLNRQREEFMSRNLWEAFPSAVGSVFEQKYRLAIKSG